MPGLLSEMRSCKATLRLEDRTWYDDHENCSTAWFWCQLVWERYTAIRKNYEITKPNRFVGDNRCLSLMDSVLDWVWGGGTVTTLALSLMEHVLGAGASAGI